ncbi:sushi, von Willebrand factor type A, EGF and pentraxin domain-containing protein 1-like [Dreissena polymorpha]|uniref:Uncharacterized protein n=1 Tax=Dreissena polymorpha TaxID=45954 RepID=A0A9D4BY53_DREPO|nr:sushi, von Willebrand factor type A, EGF and pentraxin domain-containing protein 1-like [Dreissena polymorpha]KAH3713150.1 hypothetical protein DPMN_072936 [Dreissena polymorpha]
MTSLICSVFCALLLGLAISSVDTGYAPTWDNCNCYWGAWKPWSTCTKSCGGGYQQRSRSVWKDDVPECDGFEKCASNDMGWDYQACNTHCFNTGTFMKTSDLYGNCVCPTGIQGTCCEQVVTCGTPSTISHGTVTGTNYTYNNQIEYTCSSGYNFTDVSQSVRTCTAQGTWSGSLPRCEYAISCSSNPCKNGATCINMLGGYSCSCGYMWTGKNCEVDIHPPVFSKCPENRTTFVSTMTSNQTWMEPDFHDPHGFEVVVTKNYPVNSFEFPWGVHIIQYFAVKPSNGLSVECTFEMSITPHPCPDISPPLHGLVVCNGWMVDYAQVCKVYCLEGYTLPPDFNRDIIFNCGATGQWIPSFKPQECIEDDGAFGYIDKTRIFPDCVNSTTDIGIQYVSDLKRSALNSLCTDHFESCNERNVRVLCHQQ